MTCTCRPHYFRVEYTDPTQARSIYSYPDYVLVFAYTAQDALTQAQLELDQRKALHESSQTMPGKMKGWGPITKVEPVAYSASGPDESQAATAPNGEKG